MAFVSLFSILTSHISWLYLLHIKSNKVEKLLSGKTALVTGASKGIGRGIAEKLAAHGANVAFTYLSSVEKGQALEVELQKTGTRVKGYRSDASDYKAAEELIAAVILDFGGLD